MVQTIASPRVGGLAAEAILMSCQHRPPCEGDPGTWSLVSPISLAPPLSVPDRPIPSVTTRLVLPVPEPIGGLADPLRLSTRHPYVCTLARHARSHRRPGNRKLRWRPAPVDRTILRPFHCVRITSTRCTSGLRVHRKTTAVRTVFAIRRWGICGIFRRVPTMSRSDRFKWTESLAPAAMIGPQASPYRNIHALFERRKVSAFPAILSLVTPAAIAPVASIGRSNLSVLIAV